MKQLSVTVYILVVCFLNFKMKIQDVKRCMTYLNYFSRLQMMKSITHIGDIVDYIIQINMLIQKGKKKQKFYLIKQRRPMKVRKWHS